jgi:hypothetical protein
MNKTMFRSLLAVKDRTIEELRAQNPALAHEVVALIRRAESAHLQDALRGLPTHVRAKVEAIDLTQATGDVIEHLRARLVDLSVEQKHITKVIRRARKTKLGQNLPPGQVIGAHPAVAQQIATARVHEVSAVAGLTGAVAAAVAQAAPAPSGLDDATLTRLVSEKKLTDAQARDVGFSTALYEVVGDDTALATAIRSASFPRLGGKPPASTADLAKLGGADWTTFFTSSKVALPEGATPQSVGATLAGRFAAIHPGVAITARLPQVDAGQVTGRVRLLGPLFRRNTKVVGVSFTNLDTTGLSTPQIEELRTTHAQLLQLARAYPGLDLGSVLDDPKLSPEAKAGTVARRVGLVQKVSAQLGETLVLRLDLSTGSADLGKLGLGKLDATADEQRMVVSTFQSYQRAWALARNVDDAHALVGSGFTSAVSIGVQPFARFRSEAGFDAVKAKGLWDRARSSMADVTLTAGSILDIFHGLFDHLGAGNQPPSAEEYLKKLAGFQDLFGSLSFCDCKECRSILGPAAYFVDLMKYIDENLRGQFAKRPNHPLDLKTRRPDLWTLELSCDNTNDRIATLDILDEILENYIAQRLGYTGSLSDRAAIGALVYEQTLAQVVDSFHQPFHLPLARLTWYLAELGHTRSEVAGAILASTTARVQAELGLSTRELQIVTTPDADLVHMSHLFGVTFGGSSTAVTAVDAQVLTFSGPATPVTAVDAQVHGSAMDLTREELGQLIRAAFVAAGGAQVTITLAKRDQSSVQNDVEWVNGLTADALDRMHRFTRLVRKTGWSIPDLDLALGALGDTTLGPPGVEALANLHAQEKRLGVTVAELCALVGAIPETPAGTSLFDRLFNAPSFVAADSTFPKPTTHFVHPAFRQSTAAPAAPALPRLLAGLAVDLDGLAALARHLAPHLAQEASPSFDPKAGKDEDRYFVLSADNLTLLYRHALLSRLLGVSIDDLFQLLGFIGPDHVSGLPDLLALCDLHAWWRQSGYPLDDVAMATGQAPRDPTRYPDAASVAAQVVVSAARALGFTDTVFAVALGTPEQGSRDLLTKNPGVVESPADGTWRIQAGIDLDTVAITIPASATVPTPPSGTRLVTADEVRGALRPYLAADVLVRSLGAVLGLATDKVVALAALAAKELTTDGLVKAVRGDGPIDPLTTLVSWVRPLAVVLAAPVWDAAAVDFIRLHHQLFGADDLPHLTADEQHPNVPFVSLAQLRALSTYTRLAQRQLGAAPDAPMVSPADLQAVLTAFDAAVPGFPSSSDAAMARVLGVPSGLVVGLRGRVTLPTTAAPALDQLDQAAQLANTLGVDGETFVALVSDDYDALSDAGGALIAALGARYTDETARAAKLEEAEQPIREAKRDALADYLIHSITPKVWGTLDDLVQYFLIDVEAGGCSTTSRVVAATMSAQLYVYRAIMNLEQDDLPPTDPNHVAVSFKSDPAAKADPAAEWAWRKNYRVWQANREVFLWPENYLDPDLRDDKTPLFKDLEQELLQTDISDQNVLDAYTKYLTGFEEVASLTVAGAYHDVSSSGAGTGDVLHLFGVTAGDPPTYYYRTCEDLIASSRDPNAAAVWSPWQKITVQITGRKVSPVVHNGRLHVFWTDIKTRSVNQVTGGDSKFVGYRHQMSLKFTTLRPDGTWTAPQEIELSTDGYFGPGRGQVGDPLAGRVATLDPRQRTQTEAIDDYTLSGPNWDWGWLTSAPPKLRIQFRDFLERDDLDLFGRKATAGASDYPPAPYPQLLCAKKGSGEKPLYYGTPGMMFWSGPGFANAVVDEERMDIIQLEAGLKPFLQIGLYAEQIATIPADAQLLALPGSEEDVLLQVGSDVLLLQGSVTDDAGYVLRRLGTTLVEDIARRLFEDGLDKLLDTQTQLALAEAGLPITRVGSRIEDRSNKGRLDFTGPYGIYYRELFFHIPFLIANALNSRGRFESAQRWYHYVFDPTATEAIDVTGVPAGDVAHRLLDRVWRYREFRGLDVTRLRDTLTDKVAIALYEQDPFNPWAIARRRISAFQKAIVMKYVDNLLDWADSLFTQFTMESVSEAQMLYTMASDVLGPRPAKLGDCGAGVEPNTYETIGPMVDGSSEILVELETWIVGARVSAEASSVVRGAAPKYAIDHTAIVHAVKHDPLVLGASHVSGGSSAVDPVPAASETGMFRGLGWNATRTASWGPALGNAAVKTGDKLGGRSFRHASKDGFSDRAGGFGWSVIRQLTPVFCVPANTELLAYWDRVDDRLYKIRHCMDIDGQKRELALFAPPINPMELVAMRAAGLSLDDVLGASNGNLPPYRFLYLIDRAKAFASTLSGFGAALLSSLEKKDGEHLNRVRLTQQMNLAQLTTQSRQLEVDTAAASLQAVNQQLAAAQYRSHYYADLVNQERNAWEGVESITLHTASGIKVASAQLGFLSSVSSLLPQLGSPFAMKYGGVELGGSVNRAAGAVGTMAAIMEGIAASAGLEANFTRRREGWTNQKVLAEYDMKSLDRQIKAAELRLDIANRSLVLHQKSIDQIQYILDLTDGKFTNLGLYTWLSTQLQRLYRGAYQNALALAKLAEQAFRFERGDDTSPGLAMSYWDPTHAGLIAGEQLLIDLQTLERRYLETNYRTLEVDQAFALSQIDAQALLDLRVTGECTFTVGEVFFDLFYPGHYKRRIKAARLTIPCITGPYANVSASLNLDKSWIRPTAALGPPVPPLVEVPPSRSVSIATSTAQNDGGVFELSFRDERYMPFEGLGAISQWHLTLPKSFRPFDYQTINDVILSISYTAEQDGKLRERVEMQTAALEGSIVDYFSKNPARSLLSLRQGFSSAFTRLLRTPAGTQVTIELTDSNLRVFFRGRTLQVVRGAVLLRTASGAAPAGFQMAIDGTPISGFTADSTLGNLPGQALPDAFTANLRAQHTVVIEAAGDLSPKAPPPGNIGAIDADKLLDVLLYLEYRLA